MTTIPAPRQAGPTALPRRPGLALLDELSAAWADYRASQRVENDAWELPAVQEALGRSDGLMPAVYVAAEAQTELAWCRYLRLAQAYTRGE